jgi:hypothetical protein
VLSPERKSEAATATLGIGAAAAAIACCAGLPAIVALLGGLTLGAVLGFGLGALVVAAVAWTLAAVIVRRRHRAPRSVGGGRR